VRRTWSQGTAAPVCNVLSTTGPEDLNMPALIPAGTVIETRTDEVQFAEQGPENLWGVALS
jgi:hypothetical protein